MLLYKLFCEDSYLVGSGKAVVRCIRGDELVALMHCDIRSARDVLFDARFDVTTSTDFGESVECCNTNYNTSSTNSSSSNSGGAQPECAGEGCDIYTAMCVTSKESEPELRQYVWYDKTTTLSRRQSAARLEDGVEESGRARKRARDD